jgi:DNA (cytosine-5)-methyltransferase 1
MPEQAPSEKINIGSTLAEPAQRAADEEGLLLIRRVLEIYDQAQVATILNERCGGSRNRETVNRWVKGKINPKLSHQEFNVLQNLFPKAPDHYASPDFRFVDLFAGIGGIRRAFDLIGGQCVFTSEWDKFSVRTYKANHYCDPESHHFNLDIKDITRSSDSAISDEESYRLIDRDVPDHDVLLAGFPCQPFSLAGVSKKNSLGRKHGFECSAQGTLFFDVARIIAAKRPVAFILENVKNLKSHDKGKTFAVICEALDELGYELSDVNATGPRDPKVIDAANFLPQHRERIVLVGFRRDLSVHQGFSLSNINQYFPSSKPSFGDILDDAVPDKYILTPKLWEYLYNYAAKHKAKGNGFGFGLTKKDDVARTLSARYHKDGSEILVDRGFKEGRDFYSKANLANRPRRLTPHECSRLMGFDEPGESSFIIPVSDTQAYRQFGNSVAVPVFQAVANLMKDRIIAGKRNNESPRDIQTEFRLVG